MRLRAPEPADAPAVLAVLEARDIADYGVPDFSLEDLVGEWNLSEVNIAKDAIVAEAENGTIVAYGIVRAPGSLAIVAPDAEGRGIGSQLLAWVQARERERDRGAHRQWVAAGNQSAARLLRSDGYQHVRSYWRMARTLERPPTGSSDLEPAGPPAYTIRTVDAEADVLELHTVDDLAFSTTPDYRPETLEGFREEHLAAHDLDPELSLLVQRGELIAGFLLTRRWENPPVGYVDILAVHPEHQQRGLGSWLLQSAFGRYTAAGLTEAQLGVASDNSRALRLYERVGMAARFRSDIYERPVDSKRKPG